jgi:hypothetical protein
LLLEINSLFYNHDVLHQLALAALSPYDTAPASVFKGLPSLLAMSLLFNALPTTDAILVSTSVDRSLFLTYPTLAEFIACLRCGPTDTVSTGPEPALRLPLSSAPASSQIWASGQEPVYLASRIYGHCRTSRTGPGQARSQRLHVADRSATEFIELYASTTPMHNSHCSTPHSYMTTGRKCVSSESEITVAHLLLS